MIGTRSWVHRTLAKLDAYSAAPPSSQTASSVPLGVLKEATGRGILEVYDAGVLILSTGEYIRYVDIEQVKLVGDHKPDMSKLMISTPEKVASFYVKTSTSGYRDIFVVCRFLMRVAEDHGAQLSGMEH